MVYKKLEVEVTLFYGLFATAPSLVLAAEVYSAVNEFKSIVVQLGATTTSTIKPINRVPSEIWKMISKELILANFEFCSRKIVSELSCTHCSGREVCLKECSSCQSENAPSRGIANTISWKEWTSGLFCHGSDEHFVNECDFNLHEYFNTKEKCDTTILRVDALLSIYNLQNVGTSISHQLLFRDCALKIPVGIVEKIFTQVPMSQGEDYYEREAAFSANNTFTANALTLPNSSEVGDIDARFRKVEEKYRVEFVEATDGKILDDKSFTELKYDMMENEAEVVMNPSWQLRSWVQPEHSSR